jgi:hypothetical protein
MKKAYEQFTTGAPRHPGIPCATVLTAYLVLFPVIGLSCHRRRNAQALSPDVSVETSEPHDFAVRHHAVRRAA